jgi:hypothetical protein
MLETVHAAVPPGTVALDVWLDTEPDPELRRQLRAALQRIGAELVGIDLARGSLWPLPIVTRVPASRLRITTPHEADAPGGQLAVSTLDAVGTVADWSLVQLLGCP